MTKIENINHIGIVVNNIEQSLKIWSDVFGINLDYKESIPEMNLDLAFLNIGKTRVELLEPTSKEGNEYYEFLKCNGEGFHHICFEVDNIDEMLEILKSNNFLLKDHVAIELPGRKLAFLKPESCNGVIVEFYQLD